MTMAIAEARRRARRPSSAPPPATPPPPPPPTPRGPGMPAPCSSRRARSPRQAGPGARPRRQDAAGRRQLRRLPDAGARAVRATTRSRWSIRSTRSASRARRPPPSRSWTRSATRPTSTCLPVGNAGNITAYWKGYTEYAADGVADAAAADVGLPGRRFRADRATASRSRTRTTIATAIRIGNPASWQLRAGRAGRVRRLHRRGDGPADPAPPTGCWPRRRASSSSPPRRVAWPVCCKAAEQGMVDPGQRIVCTVTGNGLKDPDWAVAGAPQPVTVPVDAAAAAERSAWRGSAARVAVKPSGRVRGAVGSRGSLKSVLPRRLRQPQRVARRLTTRIVRLLCALCRHRTFLR